MKQKYALCSFKNARGYNISSNHTIDYLNIEGNRILVDNPIFGEFNFNKGTGIRFSYPGSAVLDILNGGILSNFVFLYGQNNGIDITQMEFGFVRENYIYLSSTEAFSGIRVAGARDVDIGCNSISGISSTYDPDRNIGINVNNSQGCVYQCNNLSVTGVGLQFAGVCTQAPGGFRTDIRGNTFDGHGYGMLFRPDAMIGTNPVVGRQAHKGNKWYGNYLKDKAVHFGSPIQIQTSRFRVHDDNLPYYPYSIDTNNPDAPAPPVPNAIGTPWFSEELMMSPYSCDAEEECLPTRLVPELPDSIGAFGVALFMLIKLSGFPLISICE